MLTAEEIDESAGTALGQQHHKFGTIIAFGHVDAGERERLCILTLLPPELRKPNLMNYAVFYEYIFAGRCRYCGRYPGLGDVDAVELVMDDKGNIGTTDPNTDPYWDGDGDVCTDCFTKLQDDEDLTPHPAFSNLVETIEFFPNIVPAVEHYTQMGMDY